MKPQKGTKKSTKGTLMLVAAGAVIGVLASFGLTRFIENMLFGVTPVVLRHQ